MSTSPLCHTIRTQELSCNPRSSTPSYDAQGFGPRQTSEGLSEPKACHHVSFKNPPNDFFSFPHKNFLSPCLESSFIQSQPILGFSGQFLKQSLATEKGNKILMGPRCQEQSLLVARIPGKGQGSPAVNQVSSAAVPASPTVSLVRPHQVEARPGERMERLSSWLLCTGPELF